MPASEIARVNGLTLKSRLRPGTELAIPRTTRSSPAKVAASPKGPPPGDGSYRIQKGDTLSSVAARHSTTVEAIKALNGLNSLRRVHRPGPGLERPRTRIAAGGLLTLYTRR